MDQLITVDGLSVWFGEARVLADVDIEFRKGELTALIGPSGSGKTTQLRAVNRMNDLFPGVHTQGEVTLSLGDASVRAYGDGMDVAVLRRTAGMVFQDPNVLPASIRKNFALPLRHVLGLGKAEIEGRMEATLRDVELWDDVRDRLGDPAQTLSGGQQQRLCLARVLSMEPKALLLDEPTASLDFLATRRIEHLLEWLKERFPILAVSHSLGQTSRIADKAYVLKEGSVVETLDRSALHNAERLQKLAEELF
ncbi:MAG: ATP-binding cassette domain-containing protein [Actinomycetota bacterium]|jgi:phosphate transport system ATP-binding protein|nr:ATP-binding cassette domain-containing protein [Actinomycetota bacterium]